MSRRNRTGAARSTASDGGGARLQKVLAEAGLGSRRQCEELILEGRVEVDGTAVTELGLKVDPSRQQIRVDGIVLQRSKRVYYLVNKPVGVVCTNRDPAGRARVIDLIGSDERLFTVGRLDRSSEGLILATNDGDLSNRLTHPRYGVEKRYQVRVAGNPTRPMLDRLRRGIHLAEGLARVASVCVKRYHRQSTELEIVLNEGRNREIRRILARAGHKVLRLRRIGMGPLRLGDLPVGAYRRLTAAEVQQLQRSARQGGSSSPVRGKREGARSLFRRKPPNAAQRQRRRKELPTPSTTRPKKRRSDDDNRKPARKGR